MSKPPMHYLMFLESHPEIAQAYKALGEASMSAGPLDRMCVELVKIGASIGSRQESAVKSHARKAIDAGATPDQVRHAALVTVTTLGFPAMMAGLKWIEEALGPDLDD